QGELDWIAMKCLEKERGRRYETADALARDVERYLADEPVAAGPPSKWYQLRKVVHRNKGPGLAAALGVGALLVGVAGTAGGAGPGRAGPGGGGGATGPCRKAERHCGEAAGHRGGKREAGQQRA